MRNHLPSRLILIAIFVLALALRLFGLEIQSMWADEGGTLALAARAPAVILRDTLADVHPPLYYWILHAWMGLFGVNVAAARGLSALCGALAVVVTSVLARRWFGLRAGWVAGLLAALSPLAIHYSQEARMYALAMLIATLLFLVLDHWLGYVMLHQSPMPAPQSRFRASSATGWLFGLYLLLAAALLMTHYFAVTIVAAAALVGIGQLGYHKHYRASLLFALAHSPLAGLYLAAVLASQTRLSTWTAAKLPTDPLFVVSDVLRAFSIGMNGPPAWAWWSLLFGMVFLAGMLLPTNRSRPLIVGVWFGLPLVVIILLSLGQPYYKPRFLLPALPAFHVLVGAGVAGLFERWLSSRPQPVSMTGTLTRSRLRWRDLLLPLGVALLLSSASLPLYREWFDPRVWRDDYRGAAQAISTSARANDVLILNGQSQIDTLNVYLHSSQPRVLLPRVRPLDPPTTEAELRQIAAQYRRIYGLFYVIEESDPQGVMAGWLDAHAFPSGSRWYGDLQLRTWETGDLSDQLRPTTTRIADLQILQQAFAPATVSVGDAVRIQIDWQTDTTPAQPLSLFIHLLDVHGQLIAQYDGPLALQTPMAGARWTSRMAVIVPPATQPGRYQIALGVYNPTTGLRLRMADGADTLALGMIDVR